MYSTTTLSPLFRIALLLLLMPLLNSCSSLPEHVDKPSSFATNDYQHSAVGRVLADVSVQHAPQSGFFLVDNGADAFTARVAMTGLAEKTLDLQYYIWEADATGRLLADNVIRAAARGVRVRVLLDDNNLHERDELLVALDALPNVSIRIFNPFANRDFHVADFLGDLERVNHRMHNKTMIIDNALAVVGGRNIGDHYFSVSPESNFRDLDVLAAGPVVRKVSEQFDYFWNGTWSVPISALVEFPAVDEQKQRLLQMRQRISQDHYPYPLSSNYTELFNQLQQIVGQLRWGDCQFIWDDPAQLDEAKIVNALYQELQQVKHSLLIESAYFVLGERAMAMVKQLSSAGVSVRVLTNSLASNDVLAAHAGHAKHREQLLENGANLYELRPDALARRTEIVSLKSRAALHTKAMVFDNRTVYIGSFNLDPRSSFINTETVLAINSDALAQQLTEFMEDGVKPENSYHVERNADGNLHWTTIEQGQVVSYDSDPHSSAWQRFMVGLLQVLPIESQL
ncbi:phospholipase D family protein [Shewanella sp.]|uniref:phospholipase D family protein n=1 Tax=Shewanella sp. TaxID=50422 RepID=UPI003A96EB49